VHVLIFIKITSSEDALIQIKITFVNNPDTYITLVVEKSTFMQLSYRKESVEMAEHPVDTNFCFPSVKHLSFYMTIFRFPLCRTEAG
jgi:hypothetical protein